jgi:zinc protease
MNVARAPILCLLSLLAWQSVAADTAPGQITAVRLPEYQIFKTDNGISLLLMERHQLPLVSFRWIMRCGGSICDPEGREGLAMITAQMLRKGTQSRSADQIAEAVDFVGAGLGTSVSDDYASGEAEFVSKDFDLALDLISDMLQRPSFPADEVQKMLLQEVDAIKQEKENPSEVIARYFDGFLFGAHPYGRPSGGTETTLPKIDREQVARFFSRQYVPSQLILAVAGDFTTAQARQKIGDKFQAWKRDQVALPEVQPPAKVKGRRALLVQKPDATQSFFRFGNVALSRTNADWIPVQVVNTLFGGRFTSMINTELRIDAGLTYHAGSSFQSSLLPGAFAIGAYTKNDTTELALKKALDTLKRLHETGITEAQLLSAKTYIKGQFGPTLQTNEQLARTISDLEFYRLGPQFINTFFEKVDAVTMVDAKRIIATYFPLEDLTFVLIGQASVIEPCGKQLATGIETRIITDPGFYR